MAEGVSSYTSGSKSHLGLTGRDYSSPEIYELERERIFYRDWFCVGREEQLAKPGDFLTEDVADESILVTRTREGEFRAFYNVCQHRGARLCDESSGHANRVFVCPYHAWSYGLDGRVKSTPGLRDEKCIDREKRGLRPVAVDSWDGFLFVNLAESPRPLMDQIAADVGDPHPYQRYRTDELRVAHRIVYEVRANWKILHDNFGECLHCPILHPELAELVPLYRTGQVLDPSRDDGGVTLDKGLNTFTHSGRSKLPELPGLSELDRRSYYGYSTFPNVMANLLSTGVMVYTLFPRAVDHTTIVSEYMFRPDVIAGPKFDCSDMVKFLDLVSVQDWGICERVQQGTRSRGFDRAIYPPEDNMLHWFAERYRAKMQNTASIS